MKKLIITLLLLSHSFLAMADDEVEKLELLNFIKENNVFVGKENNNAYEGLFNDELTIDNFDKFHSLSFVDLNITELPSNLFLLPNLEDIKVKNMTLESLPTIDTLKYLELNSVNIDKLPKLSNLQKLELFNINFNKIEKDIYKNINLVRLYIEDSNLTHLSSNIGNLINLKKLTLDSTKLKELPSEIGKLTNLTSLSLYASQLTKLPKEFENLINLSYLYLTDTQIEEIPNTLLKLGYVNLSNNNLKELPDNFGENIGLRYLDLSNNNLKRLPDNFSNLKELRDLYLNDNQIEKLPKDFFSIFSVRHPDYGNWRAGADLNIANNRISFFDNSICKAFALSEFLFSGNYFDKVPTCLSEIGLWNISDVNGTIINPTTYNKYDSDTQEELILRAGWKFIEDVLITYIHKYDKTLKFTPIYPQNMDDSYYSYSWSFGDKETSIFETPTHTYQNYGDYNVTLTINNDTTFSKLITISPRVIELKKGWNMITPPTKDDINASLFDSVWSYQNEKWENSYSYLIPTIGYWVKLSEDLNYSYNGEVYELPNYKIKNGWNFIGSGEKYFRENNQTIYQYKNGEWRINPKEIKRGEGFWVKKQ